MASKQKNNKELLLAILPFALGVLYFFLVGKASASAIKGTAMFLLIAALAAGAVRFKVLRERMSWPMIALLLVVFMDGLSTLYAVSGKYAIQEYLKVLASFSLALILLSIAPKDGRAVRWGATVLEVLTGLASLVSIDMISTHIISGPVLALLGADYAGLTGLEVGVRITSLFTNPNVFAGCVGLGVLLSLGLANTCEDGWERYVHLSALYINSLGFVLAFSMGASGTIAVAFLVLLVLERRDRRSALVILMVETLVLAVLAAGLVSLTSFTARTGFRPVPLLCVIAGAAGLCLLEQKVGRKLTEKLRGREKLVPAIIAVLLAAMVMYALAGWFVTGSATVQPRASLRRAAYPEAGTYTLDVRADGPVSVTIESQDRQQTMMHTSTVLYRGDAYDASFEVPEDSLVVYFNFSAKEPVRLDFVRYVGQTGAGYIPLGYKLLPGFIANRLQGLFANENAIQRTVFFDDGLKLFKRSPIVGLGIGAFENGFRSVQSFYYVTQYTHNHYIQTMLETGVIGLLLFVGLLGVSAVCLWRAWRREEHDPLIPALGAALVFMAAHAGVEVVFSVYAYLPIAYGTFALIGLAGGDTLPVPRDKQVKTAALAVSAVVMVVFGFLLGQNMQARRIVTQERTLDSIVRAAKMDKFEWMDYMLTYVNYCTEMDVDGATREQADAYAQRLAKMDSNTVPLYLAAYYFHTDRQEDAFAMLEKYVNYTSSDAESWQSAFDLLGAYENNSADYRAGVIRLAGMMKAWNEQNMGQIVLDDAALALIERMR